MDSYRLDSAIGLDLFNVAVSQPLDGGAASGAEAAAEEVLSEAKARPEDAKGGGFNSTDELNKNIAAQVMAAISLIVEMVANGLIVVMVAMLVKAYT